MNSSFPAFGFIITASQYIYKPFMIFINLSSSSSHNRVDNLSEEAVLLNTSWQVRWYSRIIFPFIDSWRRQFIFPPCFVFEIPQNVQHTSRVYRLCFSIKAEMFCQSLWLTEFLAPAGKTQGSKRFRSTLPRAISEVVGSSATLKSPP